MIYIIVVIGYIDSGKFIVICYFVYKCSGVNKGVIEKLKRRLLRWERYYLVCLSFGLIES